MKDFMKAIQPSRVRTLTQWLFQIPGVHLNNTLDWSHNTDALCRKGQSRPHLLRSLRSFSVSRAPLRTFYDSVVASAGLCSLGSIQEVAARRMLARLTSSRSYSSHPLHHWGGPGRLLLGLISLGYFWYPGHRQELCQSFYHRLQPRQNSSATTGHMFFHAWMSSDAYCHDRSASLSPESQQINSNNEVHKFLHS